MQEEKETSKIEEPLLQEIAVGHSRKLYATNSVYLAKYNEQLATAVQEQSSFSEVFVVEFKDTYDFKLQAFIYDLVNGLIMHPALSEQLAPNQMLIKAMKILPLKAVFLYEATDDYIKTFNKVKLGTPLVNNIKSGYAPSIILETKVLTEKGYHEIDRDTAISLQLLDVNSNDMLREFATEFSKIVKGMLRAFQINLVAGEISLGIDSRNHMRIADFHLVCKDLNTDEILSKDIICSRLGL